MVCKISFDRFMRATSFKGSVNDILKNPLYKRIGNTEEALRYFTTPFGDYMGSIYRYEMETTNIKGVKIYAKIGVYHSSQYNIGFYINDLELKYLKGIHDPFYWGSHNKLILPIINIKTFDMLTKKAIHLEELLKKDDEKSSDLSKKDLKKFLEELEKTYRQILH